MTGDMAARPMNGRIYQEGKHVTPRIRCARCLPVIHRCCHVICLCVAFLSCHHVHCIAYVFVSCIRAFSPLSILRSGAPMPSGVPFFVSRCERVLNFLGMARGLPSGLGLAPVERLSSFVPFGLSLILQRLTEGPKRPRGCCSPTPLQSGPKPTYSAPSSRAFDHDHVAKNRTSFGLS